MNRLLQIGLILAVSLHAFDEMALVIALPAISSELGGELLYGVTLSSYVLAAMVATAWSGDWIDRHGPYGAFQIAIACFFAGLLMAIMADTIVKFIIARVLQG
ncbi:MAG: MFS transporter, partial [Cellvibrionales bacterium TMED148]